MVSRTGVFEGTTRPSAFSAASASAAVPPSRRTSHAARVARGCAVETANDSVRTGFNPDKPEEGSTDATHTLTEPFAVGDSDSDDLEAVGDKPGFDETGHEQPWENRVVGDDGSGSGSGSGKGKGKERRSPDIPEEKNPWSD